MPLNAVARQSETSIASTGYGHQQVAREVSALQEGEAVLQWPANLSPESAEELSDWLNLVMKKLRRRYGSEGQH